MFSAVHRLTAASLLTILIPVLCWVLTVGMGRIPLWIPYISDLALVEPGASVFQIGMLVNALLYLSLLPHLHRLVPYVGGDVLFVLASLSMVVVGFYDWLNHPWPHYIGAVLVFGGFSTWALFATLRGHPSRWRIFLLVASGVLCVSLLILSLSFAEMPASEADLHWEDRPWSMTIAASIEWLLVLTLGLMGLSFRTDLEDQALM